MKTSNKRGFTIVELVIVIAVIAILVGVLIPTFSSIVNKANEANDTVLIKSLNTSLKAAEAIDGAKPATMHDAIQATKADGYDVSKIKATASGNQILWDSVNNCFAYLKDGAITYIPESNATTVEKHQLWSIAATEQELSSEYSNYLADGFTATGVLAITTGIDVGNNTSVGEITLTRSTGTAVALTIRTNGGKLTVNAPSDTVHHYGSASSVDVVAIASASYHEHGTTPNLTLNQGRLVVESTGTVNSIIITSSSIDSVSINAKAGSTVGGVGANTQDVANALKNSDKITGVDEDKRVTTLPSSDFAGGLGTESAPYLIETAAQFAKINTLFKGSTAPYYFQQTADIEISSSQRIAYIAGGYDGAGHTIKYLSTDTTGDYIFYKQVGYTTFKNIDVEMGKYAVALLWFADWQTTFGADFDSITFSSKEQLVSVNSSNFGLIVVNLLYTEGNTEDVVTYNFKNITNNVRNLQNEGTSTGFIVGSGYGFIIKTRANYVNCVNNGNIFGNYFVGFLYGNGNKPYVETVKDSQSEVTVTDCKNNGTLQGFGTAKDVSVAPEAENVWPEEYKQSLIAGVEGGRYTKADFFSKNPFEAINQSENSFTINTAHTDVTYKLAFGIKKTLLTKDGEAWTDEDTKNTELTSDTCPWYVSNGIKYFIDLPINTLATGTLNTSVHAYDKITAAKQGIVVSNLTFTNGIAIVVKDGATCVVVDVAPDRYIDSGVELSIYAYDAAGFLVDIYKVK